MRTKTVGGQEPSAAMKFASAGLAASIAEAVTIPIDTAKVRLQVSKHFHNIHETAHHIIAP